MLIKSGGWVQVLHVAPSTWNVRCFVCLEHEKKRYNFFVSRNDNPDLLNVKQARNEKVWPAPETLLIF